MNTCINIYLLSVFNSWRFKGETSFCFSHPRKSAQLRIYNNLNTNSTNRILSTISQPISHTSFLVLLYMKYNKNQNSYLSAGTFWNLMYSSDSLFMFAHLQFFCTTSISSKLRTSSRKISIHFAPGSEVKYLINVTLPSGGHMLKL